MHRLLCLFLLFQTAILSSSQYTERLSVDSLARDRWLLKWSFEVQNEEHLIPKAIRQLKQLYGVRGFELGISSGRWRHDEIPEEIQLFPLGVTSRIQVRGNSSDDAFSNYAFSRSMGSLLSMSDLSDLNIPNDAYLQIDAKSVVGFVPRESFCSENLYSLKKLLPCGPKKGLASLIKPELLFDSYYASLSVKAVEIPATNDTHANSKLSFQVIVDSHSKDIKEWLKYKSASVPLIEKTCGLASETQLIFNQVAYGTNNLTVDWLLDQIDALSKMELQDSLLMRSSSAVSYDRYFTASGDLSGVYHLAVKNLDPSNSKTIRYLDRIPPILRVYSHTLNADIKSSQHKAKILNSSEIRLQSTQHGFQIQIWVDLEPQEELILTFKFRKLFLDMNSFPPDVSRGFDIAPGLILVRSSDKSVGAENIQMLFTENSLMMLPFPDFTMPFNIIAFTSSLVAFVYGNLVNALTRTTEEILQRRKTIFSRLFKRG